LEYQAISILFEVQSLDVCQKYFDYYLECPTNNHCNERERDRFYSHKQNGRVRMVLAWMCCRSYVHSKKTTAVDAAVVVDTTATILKATPQKRWNGGMPS
jgi:hypothetical protein